MSIREWPPSERPRERLLRCGARALSDTELLAIFIHTGCAGHSAVDIARNALRAAGGLGPLLEARQTSFCALPGLGVSRFVLLRAALELGRRYLEQRMLRGEALTRPEAEVRIYPRVERVFGLVFHALDEVVPRPAIDEVPDPVLGDRECVVGIELHATMGIAQAA